MNSESIKNNVFFDTYRCDCVLYAEKEDERQINFSRPFGYFSLTAGEHEFAPGTRPGLFFNPGKKYRITIEELTDE